MLLMGKFFLAWKNFALSSGGQAREKVPLSEEIIRDTRGNKWRSSS